jgi:hypothetical protein
MTANPAEATNAAPLTAKAPNGPECLSGQLADALVRVFMTCTGHDTPAISTNSPALAMQPER